MPNAKNRNLSGCPRCDGMMVMDPVFGETAVVAFDKLLVELVAFAKKHKLDHNNMPVLAEVGNVLRELKSLG